MRLTAEKLYELLPSIYRIRDAEQNYILHELVQIIADEVAVIEEDLAELYDNQFIETCAEWVVPYIGDLIGYTPVYHIGKTGSTRAEVANTIGFRKRKGTISVIEELAHSTTEWNAVVVEYFQRLATNQYLNHLRKNHHTMIAIRNTNMLSSIESPFDKLPHTLDVRKISSGSGLYNIPNIGLFLWRIQNYQWTDVPVAEVDAKRYRFHPLGVDIPLYNLPETEREIEHLAERKNIPWPLTWRYTSEHLNRLYGASKSFELRKDDQLIPRNQVHICNLADIGGGDWDNMPTSGVAIDPQLGRIAFANDVDSQATPLTTSFYYGFLSDLGGGSYDRTSALAVDDNPILVPDTETDIQAALTTANGSGLIQIENSHVYTDDPASISVEQDTMLTLQAANGEKPVLVSNNEIVVAGKDSGEIELNGLMIASAALRVPASFNSQPNRLQKLKIDHCTLIPGLQLNSDGTPQNPGSPGLIVEIPDLEVEIENSIIGALRINENSSVSIRDSIIDSNSHTGDAYEDTSNGFGGELSLVNTTVIGKVKTRSITLATNTIFTGTVKTERIQQGCVRFSYVPEDSRVPRRYRCVPGKEDNPELVQPIFNSLQLFDPAYCQLRHKQCVEVANGADDASEMGIYHNLQQSKREINLRIKLNEYLRFGLEAGIFYAS
jgi:hypothetical protein